MADAESIVREFCAAWSRLDADELTNYFTDDAVYHNMPMAPLNGREAIRAFLAGFLAGVTFAEFEILNVMADGDIVMTERVDHFELNGKRGGFPVMGIFELRDGKIAAWRDYFDLAQVTAFLTGSAT
jgi:limonene-1,2-epoxide hydrolase